MAWEVAFVLPNVQVQLPIETTHMALVPFNHVRVRELRAEHAVLDRYLARFTDAVGEKVEPSVLMHRYPSPKTTRTHDAFAGFRDLLAISVVPVSRARSLTQRSRPTAIHFSNYFDPFPWFVTNDYKAILLATPSVTHFNEISKFRGHSHADLFTHQLSDYEIDQVLLERLIEEWRLRFAVKNPSKDSVTLFRSLNMAAQAARMPAATGVTLFDVGRLMILWSSAFEILVNPGLGHDNKQLGRIYDVLETVQWVTPFARQRIYSVYGSPRQKRGAACWLYSLIHKLRNDFVHGNPVDRRQIKLPGTKLPLWMHVAPLYRLMLTAYLDLSFKKPFPKGNTEAFSRVYFECSDFLRAQKLMEEAIRSAKPRSISKGKKLAVYDNTPHQRILRAKRTLLTH
jgi:hypothetical protein